MTEINHDHIKDDRVHRDDRVITVSALNQEIAQVLKRMFPLVWIGGEVTGFTRAASGHWYFSLKDAYAQIACVMFRGRAQYTDFVPRNGDYIEARALLSMYEPRGDLQLNVESIRRAGQGRLYEAFLRLKEELAAQGFFDIARKKILPKFVQRVGIVTSLQGAALHDVLTTLARRTPHLHIIIYPSQVQGAGASLALANALDKANQRLEVDVLLLCRGGGSLEDLWAFNEKILAHAMMRSQLPIVTGVGHETDFTIADFVADLRAPTPTAAAELVSSSRNTYVESIKNNAYFLNSALEHVLNRYAQQLDAIARLLKTPGEQLRQQEKKLSHYVMQLCSRMNQSLDVQRSQLHSASICFSQNKPPVTTLRAALSNDLQNRWLGQSHTYYANMRYQIDVIKNHLNALNPQHVLDRGYAIVEDKEGHVLRNPNQLRAGQQVTVHMAEGSVDMAVADSFSHSSQK